MSGNDDAEKRLAKLRKEVQKETRALVKREPQAALAKADPAAPIVIVRSPDKSVLASGLLSLLFGPAGWLYAAPYKVAGVAALLYVCAASIIPHVLLLPLLGIINPISAVGGVLYALRHNQRGERASLLPEDPKKALAAPKKR